MPLFFGQYPSARFTSPVEKEGILTSKELRFLAVGVD